MVKLEHVLAAVNVRVSQVLLVAESSLGATQFPAFRKFVLDQFGNNGLVKDLKQLPSETKDRHG